MNTVWIKRGGLLLVGLAVVGGFAWALREQPVLVDVAQIAETPMEVIIRQEGVTRVRDVYRVSAPIAGNLSRTVLQEGDPVEAGKTIIAAIHPLSSPLLDRRTEAELSATRDVARSGVEIAKTELARARAGLKLAEEELARALRLFKPGVISESALQRVTSEVDVQRSAVEAAHATVAFREAELASVEARMRQPEEGTATDGSCCVELRAPVDGTVLSVSARSEQPVAAGTQIAEVGDLSKLEIVADLLSADAVRVLPGTKARIVEWGEERPLAAVVRKIDPAAFTKVSALGISEQRVNAVLDLVETDRRLGHGFRVVAELTVWECGRCLTVSIGALFRSGERWSTFVMEGERLRLRLVEIGRMNDDVAEIRDGLAAGETVVLHPSDVLADGSLVARR